MSTVLKEARQFLSTIWASDVVLAVDLYVFLGLPDVAGLQSS